MTSFAVIDLEMIGLNRVEAVTDAQAGIPIGKLRFGIVLKGNVFFTRNQDLLMVNVYMYVYIFLLSSLATNRLTALLRLFATYS